LFFGERSLLHKILDVVLKTAESRTNGAWEPDVALGTAVENYCCRCAVCKSRKRWCS